MATVARSLIRRTKPQAWPYPGTYDPSIDIQVASANRGFNDLQSDYRTNWGELGQTGGGRAWTQYGWQQGDLNQQQAALERTSARSLKDLLTARTRGTEDYRRNLAELARSYMRLGGQQRQATMASGGGIMQRGIAAQAAAKRSANQAWDRKPIDTGYNRFLSDSRLSETRLGEDKRSALDQLLQARQRATSQFGWESDDALTALGRAGRENEQFKVDAAKLAWASSGMPVPGPTQTNSAVYSPKKRPKARGRRAGYG